MKPLTPSTPHVIVMVGIPGAGKTHFAQHFAKTFSAPFLNYHEIAALAEATEAKGLEASAHLLGELMKTQRTIILEMPLHTPQSRHALTKKVRAAGYAPLFVWVQTDSDEARRRSTKRGARHTKESFDASLGRFQALSQKESFIVISGKHTFATQVKSVLRHLAEPRPKTPVKPRPNGRSDRTITVR